MKNTRADCILTTEEDTLTMPGFLHMRASTVPKQSMRDFREVLARCKDFATTIFKPEPDHLGEAIPVSGNGDQTNDD